MDDALLQRCYCLIGEALLNPEDRDRERVSALMESLEGVPAETIGQPLRRFLDDERAWASDEYVQTLELAPPCPLYLGAYLFQEPSSCRGVGTSTRNGYMIELRGIYEHFGLETSSAELPDYLPLMVDFLWVSSSRAERDGIGLRRFYMERYLRPGLDPLYQRLIEYESVYAPVVDVLRHAVDAELSRPEDEQPRWQPPVTVTTEENKRGLRVLADPNEVQR